MRLVLAINIIMKIHILVWILYIWHTHYYKSVNWVDYRMMESFSTPTVSNFIAGMRMCLCIVNIS